MIKQVYSIDVLKMCLGFQCTITSRLGNGSDGCVVEDYDIDNYYMNHYIVTRIPLYDILKDKKLWKLLFD
jgi:hypothetical protein